ncbi:MAG TPA: BON domain-containing protein [Gemmata sp.]
MNTCPELTDVLTSSPLGQLRRLNVTKSDTQVVITGQVSSYYYKQMAQESLRSAVGKRTIVNQVEVCPQDVA